MTSVSRDALNASWKTACERVPDLSALFFDLDGTLVDTMRLHHLAYQKVLSAYGGTFTRTDFDALVGPPAAVTIPHFVQAAGLDADSMPPTRQLHDEKKDAFEAILRDTALDLLPAAQLLIETHDNYRIAVVTSGNARGAARILQSAGLDTYADVLVTGDDVTRGKPDPEPYALALSRLGVTSNNGLAFEDHENGLQSAIDAGLTVIDVRSGRLMPDRDKK